MTPILDEMYNAFLKNQIPKMWSSVSYPSLKPLGAWFEDFLLRNQFIQNWLDNGKPKAYWLSCFFFPQGFLTSILQNYSRRLKIPVDKLSYRYQILSITTYEQIMGPPAEGCYIYGLYAEGFRFINLILEWKLFKIKSLWKILYLDKYLPMLPLFNSFQLKHLFQKILTLYVLFIKHFLEQEAYQQQDQAQISL